MTRRPHGRKGDPGRRLTMTASPVFAAMALVTALHTPAAGALCISGPVHSAVLHGMPLMYALMAVFHLGPWLSWTMSRSSFAGDVVDGSERGQI